MNRLRRLALLVGVAAIAAVLAACGPKEITRDQSTGGQGVPAPTVSP
jgi:hypothetical protein